MSKREHDDGIVGYGRPPKRSRFRPGTSGNPQGRPRGSGKPAKNLPPIFPTRTLLAEEAARLVPIREGDKRLEIPATQAVLRALAMKGMQGGVLAARTYLQYQMAEDEREAVERKERFDFWRNYVREERKRVDEAREHGRPIPNLVPHPDDIEFNYVSWEVAFHGPMNAAQAAGASGRRADADLYYELSIYFGESDLGEPTDENPIYGVFMFLYLATLFTLPKRLWSMSEESQDAIERRIISGRGRWTSALQARCAEHDLAIDIRKTGMRSINLRLAGVRLGPDGFEPYKWPKPKKE